MRIVRLVGAAFLAVLLAGCGAATAQLSAVESDTAPTVSQAARALDATFGDRRTWPNGLAVTLSQPRSVQPSSAAYPQAARAAVFELTVENGTSTTYKPSQLAVKATLGDAAAQEVVDPAQGLGGYVAAQDDLAPGKTVQLTVAFAMPQQPAQLRILVQPDVVDSVPTVAFAGTA